MAGLQTTNHLGGINSKKPGVVANTKNVFLGKRGVMGAQTTRTVMGEIGNVTVSSNKLGVRQTQKAAANLPPFQKPGRAMAKQKCTTYRVQGAPNLYVSENDAASQRPIGNLRKRKYSLEMSDSKEVDVRNTPQVEENVEMEVESAPVQGFSTKNLGLFNVEDIDSEDIDDPQLVVEYINEIYEYMRLMEKQQSVKKAYLDGKIGTILPKMRSVLVDWLVEVHQQFSLLQETLYMSVAIFDRYMQVAAEKVPRKNLQLVGVTAMFIAAKYEEMCAPEISDFVYITDNACTQNQIRDTEIKIMTVLKFDMGRPLPLHFLRRNSKAGQVDGTAHMLAKYVMELTLLEYSFVHVLPSEIAAAALAFSLKALDIEEKPLSELWNKTLQYYSQYELKDISETLQQVASIVLTTTRAPKKSKLLGIRKKYANKKFGKIADYTELTNQAVQDMAKGIF